MQQRTQSNQDIKRTIEIALMAWFLATKSPIRRITGGKIMNRDFVEALENLYQLGLEHAKKKDEMRLERERLVEQAVLLSKESEPNKE